VWIQSVDYLLAAAGLVGHVALLVLILRRRLLTRLPAFAILIAFYLLRSALLLAPQLTRESPATYWVLIYLDPGLQILLILALAVGARRITGGTIGRLRIILMALAMIVLACVGAWFLGSSSHYSPRNLSLKLSMFVSLLWIEAALGLAAMLRRSDWQTKRLPLGIAFGFATYAVANILTELVHMRFMLSRQPSLYTGLSLFRVIVYLSCLAWWFVLLWRDRPRLSPVFHTIEC